MAQGTNIWEGLMHREGTVRDSGDNKVKAGDPFKLEGYFDGTVSPQKRCILFEVYGKDTPHEGLFLRRWSDPHYRGNTYLLEAFDPNTVGRLEERRVLRVYFDP